MSSYVYPGCGYGGYCLPKDTNALYATATNKGVSPGILRHVIDTNENMPATIARRISQKIEKEQKIGILGLSFTPGSNDVRDSASAKIIRELLDLGYPHIIGYDPVAVSEFRDYYDLNIQYTTQLEQICEVADVLIILTAWPEFYKVKETARKLVLDYRYM